MNRLDKREVAVQCWEDADFPVLCASCLGQESSVRMQKEPFGTECKVCLKPYTTFRWSPGTGMRFRRTLICLTCSRAKLVCQSCILDLRYGLPVQVRDRLLGIEDQVPEQTTNRDHFFLHNQLADCSRFERGSNGSAGKEALLLLQREFQTNQDLLHYRNLPYVCSFFLKGTCNRGSSCPYSHDPRAESELNRTKIMNRYFGRKDPVAEQLLSQFRSYPPAFHDKTITSVCIHELNPLLITEEWIRKVFGDYGDIKSVVIVRDEKIAFVNYLRRDAADRAVDEFLERGIEFEGAKMRVTWAYGKPKGPQQQLTLESVIEGEQVLQSDVKPAKKALPLPGSSCLKYAAMDPHQLGTIVRK